MKDTYPSGKDEKKEGGNGEALPTQAKAWEKKRGTL